ncbi:MAG: hypothetical protein H6686_08665 [Fibrobacteria bacterium]|nr:hypothetical protein [Fibrobacteria bacterium]
MGNEIKWKQSALPIIGVVGIALSIELQLWRGVFFGVPEMGDLYTYFYPFWSFFRNSLLSGNMPFWMDSQELGFPFIYNPQCSIFYLPNYLLLLPFGVALHVYLLFPFILFYSGLLLYLRSLRIDVKQAVVGSVWCTLSGVLIGLFSMTTVLHTLAWLPWLLLYRAAFKSPQKKMLGGVILAQSFLSGAWDFWIFMFPTAVLMDVGVIRSWKSLLQIGIIAAGIMLPQVLMTGAYLPLTIRSDSVNVEETLHWSAGLHHFLGLVSPNIQMSSLGGDVWFEFFGGRIGWTLSTYVSTPIILLIPLAIIFSWRSRRILLAYLVLVFALSSTGSIGFVFKLLQNSGITVPIRYPDKLLPVLLVALSILVVSSAPFYLRYWNSKKRVWNSLWLLILPASLLAAFPFARDNILDSKIPGYLPSADYLVGVRAIYEYFSTRDALVFGAFSIASVMIIVVSGKRFKSAFIALALVGIVDLLLSGTKWCSVRPLPKQKLDLESLGYTPSRFALIDSYLHNVLAQREKATIDLSGAAIPDVEMLVSNTSLGMPSGWFGLNGINVLPLRNSRKLTTLATIHPDFVKREIFWRSSVRWVIGDSVEVKKFLHGDLKCHSFDGDGVVCRIEDGEIARWHEKAVFVDSLPDVGKRMLAIERDRNSVYLVESDRGNVGKLNGSGLRQVEKIEWMQSKREVTLPAHHNDGVLVFSQSFHPDWKAVDERGMSLPVIQADYALLGVPASAGTQRVTLRFSAARIIVCSACGIVILVFGIFFALSIGVPHDGRINEE